MFIFVPFFISHSCAACFVPIFLFPEMRPKVIKEKPDLSFGEVGKELGARWRALSDEKKAEWKAKPE